MTGDLFHSQYATHRVILVPPQAAARNRPRFVAAVRSAVQQQRALSEKCDAVVRIVGDVIEDGDRLIVEHEPISLIDPAAVVDTALKRDIGELWWFAWLGARALAAASSAKVVHGGLHLGALAIDAVARVKFADFGVATAFEAADLDAETRACIVCEQALAADETGRVVSTIWRVIDEGAELPHGWISPYFAQEVLKRETKLSHEADQFSLGTMLYALATGMAPFGQSFGESHPFVYVKNKPAPTISFKRADQADWKEAADRAEKQQVEEDKHRKRADWMELVERRLLSFDRKRRFEQPAELAEFVARHASPKWEQAYTDLSEAIELMEGGVADQALARLARCAEATELPAVWRARIQARIGPLEAEVRQARVRREVDALLRDAAAMLGADFRKARDLARKALASAESAAELAPQAQRAADMIRECDALEEEIGGKALELLRAQLENAATFLESGDFADARHIAQGVAGDAAAPDKLRAEAKEMIAAIDAAEKASAHAASAIEKSKAALEALDPATAWSAIADVLEDERLPGRFRAEAESLRERIGQLEEQVAQWTEGLNLAEQACASGAADDAEALLASLPPLIPPALAQRRDVIEAATKRIRGWAKLIDDAERQHALNEHVQARRILERLLHEAGLPEALRERAEQLDETCAQRIQEAQAEEIAAARRRFADARGLWDAGKLEECEREFDAAAASGLLPKDEAAAAHQRSAESRKLRAALTEIRKHLAASADDEADRVIQGIAAVAAPAPVAKALDDARQKVAQLRAAAEQRRLEALHKELSAVESSLSRGKLDEAAAQLAAIKPPGAAPAEDTARLGAAMRLLAELRSLSESLDAVESLVRDGKLKSAQEQLAALLPRATPDWARSRADALRKQIDEAARERVRKIRAEIEQALANAEASLQKLDLDAAAAALKPIESRLEHAADLKPRFEAIESERALLAKWSPKLDAVRAQLEAGRLLDSQASATSLLAQTKDVPRIAKALTAVRDDAAKRIAERRRQIDDEIASLRTDLEKHKRRARQFVPRVEALAGDALATTEQKSALAQLKTQYEQLPVPKAPWKPIVGAIGAIAVVAVVIGVVLSRKDDKKQDGPPTTRNPAVAFVGALSHADGKLTLNYDLSLTDTDAAPVYTIQFRVDGAPVGTPTTGATSPGKHSAACPLPPASAERSASVELLAPGWPADVKRSVQVDALRIAPEMPARNPTATVRGTLSHDQGRVTLNYTVALSEMDAAFPYTIQLVVDGKDVGAPVPAEVSPGEHTAEFAFSAADVDRSVSVRFIPGAGWPAETEVKRSFSASSVTVAKMMMQPTDPPPLPATIALADVAGLIGDAAKSRLAALAKYGASPPETLAVAGAWAGQGDSRTADCSVKLDDVNAIALRAGVAREGDKWGAITWAPADAAAAGNSLNAAIDALGVPLVSTALEAGKLADAHRIRADLGLSKPELPAAYSEQRAQAAGFTAAGAIDPASGYPQALVHSGGAKFSLVFAGPKDPAWTLVGAVLGPDVQPAWAVYYIADADSGPIKDHAAAAARAAQLGGALPTRAEWLLAAFKLSARAAAMRMFGSSEPANVAEWCDDGWTLGGNATISRLSPPPKDGAALAEWLRGPLVMQQRSLGQGIVGVRPVWRP